MYRIRYPTSSLPTWLFVTRFQVSIPALNDSKLIGISVYNVVILCIVGLAINLVLGQDPQTAFIFNSAIAIFCTTLTVLIVFLPKVMYDVLQLFPSQHWHNTAYTVFSESPWLAYIPWGWEHWISTSCCYCGRLIHPDNQRQPARRIF